VYIVQDVRVTFNLDKNGLIFVQSAQLVEEVAATEEPPAVPEVEGEAKDVKEEKVCGRIICVCKDIFCTIGSLWLLILLQFDGLSLLLVATCVQDANPAPAKKKFKKTDLEVIVESFGVSRDQVKASIELEASMVSTPSPSLRQSPCDTSY
jgi:hypothetical protein